MRSCNSNNQNIYRENSDYEMSNDSKNMERATTRTVTPWSWQNLGSVELMVSVLFSRRFRAEKGVGIERGDGEQEAKNCCSCHIFLPL